MSWRGRGRIGPVHRVEGESPNDATLRRSLIPRAAIPHLLRPKSQAEFQVAPFAYPPLGHSASLSAFFFRKPHFSEDDLAYRVERYKQKLSGFQLFQRVGNPIFARNLGCFFLVGGRLVISKFHGFIGK